MYSSTETAKITHIWFTPRHKLVSTIFHNKIHIYCYVNHNKEKPIFLDMIDTMQILVNIQDLIGMSIQSASKLIREKQIKYNKMLTLLTG